MAKVSTIWQGGRTFRVDPLELGAAVTEKGILVVAGQPGVELIEGAVVGVDPRSGGPTYQRKTLWLAVLFACHESEQSTM